MKKLYLLLCLSISLFSCTHDALKEDLIGSWQGVAVEQVYFLKQATNNGTLTTEVIRTSYNENFSVEFSKGDYLKKRGSYLINEVTKENGYIVKEQDGINEDYKEDIHYLVLEDDLTFSYDDFEDDSDLIDDITFTITTLTDDELIFERTIDLPTAPHDYATIEATLKEVYVFRR